MPLSIRLAYPLLVTSLLAVGAVAQEKTSVAPEADAPTEVITLPVFSVNTAKDDGFLATQSTSGTRTATEIINLPFSISVLSEDFIKEFQFYDLEQMAPFIAGMAAGDAMAGSGAGNRLRGFPVPYFRNGFYRSMAPDSNGIARVEVVKGPQSAIYGRVSPGGVVNYISKKPEAKFKSDLSYVLGTYDYNRVAGSVTGPVVPGKLFFRTDATYYDFEAPTDFWFNRTYSASAAVTYKISPDTAVTLEHEQTNRTMQGGQAFTRWQRVVNGVTITEGSAFYMPDQELGDRLARFSSSGAFNRTIRSSEATYLTFEHKISADLSLRANLAYTTREFFRHGPSTPVTWSVNPAAARQTVLNTLVGIWADTTRGIWTSSRSMTHQNIDYEEKGFQVDLTKEWHTKLKQRTLLTFDAFNNNQHSRTWSLSGTPLNNALTALGYTTTAQRNAWLNPDPLSPDISGYLAIPSFDAATWTATAPVNLDRQYYGSLINHTVDFMNGRLSWTASARQDWAQFKNDADEGDVSVFTYNTGLNYHVIPRKVIAYGNVASGFNPSVDIDPNTGELLGNRMSTGGEIGLKGLILNESFSYTLAYFDVKQRNEVTDNPANPGGVDLTLPSLIPGASTRSQGGSLEVSGKVSANFTLLANMAYTDTRIVKHATTPSLVGTHPAGGQGVPLHSYAVAGRYSFRKGALKGFRIGLTYQYAQDYLRVAPVTTAGVVTSVPYNIEERNEWSGVIGYSKKLRGKFTWSAALNVNNIFDQTKLSVNAYYPLGRELRFTTGLSF